MIKNLALGGGQNRAYLALALVLGLIAAILIGVFLSQAGGGSGGGTTVNTVPVVVAAKDIPAFTRVTEDMVVVKSLSVDSALSGAFASTDKVVGQVTQVPVAAGEQLLPTRVTSTDVALANFGGNAPLSLIVPSGKRAFAIALSEVGSVGGLLRPGDFVDVILSGSAVGATGGKTLLTPGSACFIAQDIQVLAVGQTIKKSGTDDANSIAATGPDNAAKSATLAVSPDEAWWLAAAQQSVNQQGVGNQLWISLRAFGDRGANASLPACGVIPGS